MLGQLVPVGGGDPIPLLKPHLLIGRRSSCDITLAFPNVSSHHCELELQNGYWFIRDLNSSNGIKVNGQRLDSKYLLPGDEVAIAKHRFEIQYTPTNEAPPPAEEQDPFSVGLLEKAGLERSQRARKRREEEQRTPPQGQTGSNGSKPSRSSSKDDENQILEWLTGEDV